MSAPADGLDDRRIERALEPLLARWLGSGSRIVAARRSPHPYGSSHALEALDLELAGGRTVALLLKRTGLPSGALGALRPDFIDDPDREPETYREILGPCRVGAPACLGTLSLPATGTDGERVRWLVLERIDGAELYQTGDPLVWQEAARWLAGLHARFDRRADRFETRRLDRAGRLLRRDAAFHRTWWQRAVQLTRLGRPPADAVALERVRPRFELAVERADSLPATFLHGEFYPANVLAERGAQGVRIRPVDWEMASLGPGLLDLAALTAGRWTESERDGMIEAYRDATPPAQRLPRAGFEEALDDCRLLLAVQWLGWAAAWTPPPEHAHDWLADALMIAGRAPTRGGIPSLHAVTTS